MTPADISVVIPTLNEAVSVALAVRSAREAGAGQVVVSDGGSTDGTLEHASAAGASVVVRSIRGRGIQQNSGSTFARGEYILFLHADSRLSPQALVQICQAHGSDPSLLWGAFRQRIEDDRAIYRSLEWGNSLRARWRGMAFGDQAMFVRRQEFKRAGGFSEVPLMEDVELSQKLRKQRWPVLLEGPVFVSARRWQSRGVVRQTLLNQGLQLAHALGVAPERIARWYG